MLVGMSAAGDPLTAMRFRVEIDGLKASDFFEVLFPEAVLEAGRERFTPMVVRRAASADRELSDWWDQTARGRPAPRTLSVILLDARGHEQIRLKFARARPVRYALSPLNAVDPALLMETIELEVESFERG